MSPISLSARKSLAIVGSTGGFATCDDKTRVMRANGNGMSSEFATSMTDIIALKAVSAMVEGRARSLQLTLEYLRVNLEELRGRVCL